ncbi:MAG: methyltransferase domain-containing protein [Acidobacteria bacterium]|nr:methyltransferase domain-containing protein [Acidobacteriota bacterium]
MPPAKSGIADYSAALVEALHRHAQVTVQEQAGPAAGLGLYQIGNNGHHAFVYEEALRHPGVVVLHESNLHHLITDLTICRQDWDAYVAACEFDGGPAALAFAERVRRLEVGPDYEGVPMLKRILAASRGVIVHSEAVAQDVRRAGYSGPLAKIPHGAWLPELGDRMGFRTRLGLDQATPLIGIFGFLKPYKRIAESLRAFKRLIRLRPDARMVLVGEAHPDFPLASLIRGMGLEEHVRLLGFTPIEDFNGYIAACDVILNLRFPTVGESSGTLLRSLGMGRAVIVSNIGSFAEYPDSICLKVPVDATEEDTIFEYLNLLVSRPELGRQMGARARAWVEQECSWDICARQYVDFLDAVESGRTWTPAIVAAPFPAPPEEPIEAPAPVVEPAYIQTWMAETEESKQYGEIHLTRFEKTLAITPPGSALDRILEMGAYLQITPALKNKLGYGEVRGCYYGPAGEVDHRSVTSSEGETFTCDVDLFDAEKDIFPYPDEYFSTVLCCELIEHLPSDPMHMMAEINRILKPGGHFVVTTPNIASLRALRAALDGYHPGFFPAYIKPSKPGEEVEARHAREYTPKEIYLLLLDAGFEVALLETGEFRDVPRPEDQWILHLLERYLLPTTLRGDGIYAVGKKLGPIQKRYPAWLYEGGS